MINNFSGYFENKHDIFLEDISYSRLETNITTDCSLNCTDNINGKSRNKACCDESFRI